VFAIPTLLGLVLAAPVDESALSAARLPTTDKALLNFFHKRTQPPPGRAVIEQLARALNSQNATAADDAQGELVSIGTPVVPVLLRSPIGWMTSAPLDARRRSCN
jgi:hypothetical protein